MEENYETVKLNYTIHKFSSYSGNYVPENIMVNKPTEQLSRWFTDSNSSSQFIILKLSSLAIVETITFGKYLKPHVSDLKKFEVFGGTDDDDFTSIYTGGLKNDNSTETFRLRHRTTEGLLIPVRYIKIVPLQSWGPAYNYTIWYVDLHGKNNATYIRTALETINLRKEEEAVRILLKHLRRRRYKDAFEALSRETGVRLEGATQSKIWNALVENGDYELTEKLVNQAIDDGEFDWYLSWQPYIPKWTLLSPCSSQVEESLSCSSPTIPTSKLRTQDLACADRELMAEYTEMTAMPGAESCDSCDSGTSSIAQTSNCRPGPRGGHQLVVDVTTGHLYLFGGWNGTEDLDDLWLYDVDHNRWSLLAVHSAQVGGPSPRSCHKLVFDPIHRRLYTLGRYLDVTQRLPDNMKSDLYMYCISTNQWSLVCSDTASVGGPRLVFDHQMCIDPDTQTIYVFGGRVLPSNSVDVESPQYSGLYAYYIEPNTWELLFDDSQNKNAPQPRVGHSMLFHAPQRRLYIFAGQRNKETLLDLWWWDVGRRGGPGGAWGAGGGRGPRAEGLTQRATLDAHTGTMYLLSGMSKEKDKRVYNTLWVFSLRRQTWSCVYRNDKVLPTEPMPRFAHQFVYDPCRKTHYLFGGNPGVSHSPRARLDDLWSLEVRRGGEGGARGEAAGRVRGARYVELARGDPLAAVRYLRGDLTEVVDRTDPVQVAQFHKLATILFSGPDTDVRPCVRVSPASLRRLARKKYRNTHIHTRDLTNDLAAVLGAEDAVIEEVTPFEEVEDILEEGSWDVRDIHHHSDDEQDTSEQSAMDLRAHRIALYDDLCKYFRPSVTPPKADVTHLVKL